jgi:hypothetical protein
MHKALLQTSPFVALGLFAMLVFFVVFMSVVIRAMATRKTLMSEASLLPFEEGDEPLAPRAALEPRREAIRHGGNHG